MIDPTEGYVESQGQSRKQAERWEEDVRNRTKYVLQRADWLADEYDVERSTERLSGTVSYEILDRTEGSDVDHIVVGRRNRSPVARSIRGGTSDAIVRRSRIPVTIVDESHAAARVRGADDGLRTDVDDDGGRG